MLHFHCSFLRFVSIVACILNLTQSCAEHALDIDDPAIIAANHAARKAPQASQKIALYNVRVFDGERILPPSTVIIDNGVIGINPFGARFINGQGHVLLPGFIDTHCHPGTVNQLHELSSYGITTAFLQSGSSPDVRESLMNHPGVTELRFASTPAVATNDSRVVPPLIKKEGGFIYSPDQAPDFIRNQSARSDWIKILAVSPDMPTIAQPVLDALVLSSNHHGMRTVCHATAYESVRQALKAGVSQVHHSPVDKTLDDTVAQLYLAGRQPNCPTLVAMQAIAYANPLAGYNYTVAAKSVTALYKAGVPILAGTDATSSPGIPFVVPFSGSMHLELQFLVEAGLSNLDALRAVTVLPAEYYGLRDRGSVRPGMRADLVLVGGDPLKDISHARDIKKIWVAGVEHAVNTTTTLTREGLKKLNPPRPPRQLWETQGQGAVQKLLSLPISLRMKLTPKFGEVFSN
ncbi:MAG: hypothetical protein Q9195_009365 [Heterodermia aff. obscurata]